MLRTCARRATRPRSCIGSNTFRCLRSNVLPARLSSALHVSVGMRSPCKLLVGVTAACCCACTLALTTSQSFRPCAPLGWGLCWRMVVGWSQYPCRSLPYVWCRHWIFQRWGKEHLAYTLKLLVFFCRGQPCVWSVLESRREALHFQVFRAGHVQGGGGNLASVLPRYRFRPQVRPWLSGRT